MHECLVVICGATLCTWYMVEYGNGCNNIDSVLLYFISQQ